MIIACPECTKPFEVEDSEIAPLVQIECPHCVFRMILDFEAANDASLIEAGMQMAQGFSSEAEYRTAVGAGEVSLSSSSASSPAPRLVAEPAPEPEPAHEPDPEPEPRWTPEPRTPPVQPASEKPPVRQPPVSLPEPEPEPEKPPVRIHRATFEPAPEPAPPEPRPTETPTFVPESRSRPTLIAVSAPPPALRPPVHPAEVDVEVDIDSGDSEPALPSPDARHTPPHTPPIIPPVARPEIEEPSRPAADSQSKPIEPPREREPVAALDDSIKLAPKPSALGTVLKVLLLLLLLGIAGVMVWSLIETSSPNPLPMLQEKFGISL